MARITVSEAKKICTKAELGLLMACRPKAIERLSADELKKNVVSARRLRDKWRDLATEQRRETQWQQKSRVTDDNARSGEKAALFAHALTKFEAQLKKAESTGGSAKSAPKASDKKPKKAERAQTHREVRSITRGYLKEARREFNAAGEATKSAPKKKTAKKKVAAASAVATKKVATKKTAAVTKKKVAKKVVAAKSPRKQVAKKKVAKTPQKTGLVAADARQQLAAKTAAKKSRITASGLLARVRGHVVARGRRAQGKRDSRG